MVAAQTLVRVGLALSATMLCLSLAAPSSAATDADEPPRWAYQMAHDLMSPFCPGRTLAECSSPQADELRLWILLQAAGGASQTEVEASLLERFGDRILSAPRAEGWGITAYALPIVGFLLGGGIVVVVLRRMAGASTDVAPAPAVAATAPAATAAVASDAELERLIDEDLRA